MTTISTDQVAAIARLARLAPDEARLETFARQFGDILGYMEMLNGLDTTGVEPLYSPVEHATALRPDEAAPRCTREDVLRNAPEADHEFFIVPRIV